ncbi:MAG: ABC transporter permease [Acidobacteriota bacterium]|nr:ABC transporter permease [Acidobacteriota bacterium]
MDGLRGFWHRLLALLGQSRYRHELDEEMAFHREQTERALREDGMSPEAAHRATALKFGNTTLLKEQSHDAVGFRFESIAQDVRFALRQLRRQPAFALLATVILALGMGASVAIFGFVDAALLQPLPYTQPNRLMDVGERANVHPRSNLSYQDFEDWKRLNRSFSGFDAYTGGGFLLHSSGGVEPVPAGRVTAGFFDTLGIKPLLGRTFRAGEDKPGAGKVVVLTYGTWLSRFGARPDVVGQTLQLDSDNYTIIGVLPRLFSFAPRGSADVWVPISDLTPCEQRRSCHNLFAVGRLRDGVTESAAREDLAAIAAQLEREYPGSNQGQGAFVQPLSQLIVGDVRPILLTLLGGALLVLVIASVNVSSLLLVRSESRRREIAVRGALGATPARLVRQFITEGLLLAAGGTAVGLAVALWLMSLLAHLVPEQMSNQLPFIKLVGLNEHTLLFALAVATLVTLLLAFTPTLRLSFQQIHDGLAEGGRGAAGRLWRRLGSNLVVVELAVAVVLLVGAGLLGKSFYNLLHVDMGFDPSHLAMVNVQLPRDAYAKDAERLALYRTMEQNLAALPGVQSVAFTDTPPVQCFCNTDWIRIPGRPFHGEHNEVVERDVTPSYMATLKARLIRGRMFREDEDKSKPTVILINQSLARKYFPGEDPVGKMIGNGALDKSSMREIVGVVADVREGALDDEMLPGEYFNINQQLDTGFIVLVRTAQNEKSILPSMVSTVRSIDPNIGLYGEITMNDMIDSTQSALLHRFSTWLVGGFALIALVLGVVGLYGVIAYSVSQRTREIGVRMALGAQRSAVYGMVMRQAAQLTAIGLVVGLACAIGTSMLIRKLLFGVDAWDIPTLLIVAVLLGLASIAASFVPARKAATVNPTDALRAE